MSSSIMGKRNKSFTENICQILKRKCADLSPVAFSSTLVLDVVIHEYEVLSNFICNGCILIGIDIAEGNICFLLLQRSCGPGIFPKKVSMHKARIFCFVTDQV